MKDVMLCLIQSASLIGAVDDYLGSDMPSTTIFLYVCESVTVSNLNMRFIKECKRQVFEQFLLIRLSKN